MQHFLYSPNSNSQRLADGLPILVSYSCRRSWSIVVTPLRETNLAVRDNLAGVNIALSGIRNENEKLAKLAMRTSNFSSPQFSPCRGRDLIKRLTHPYSVLALNTVRDRKANPQPLTQTEMLA